MPGSDEAAASDGIECISAVTLAVSDMGRAVAFYGDLGFEVRYGGADDEFTSLRAGPGYLNLQHDPAWRPVSGCGVGSSCGSTTSTRCTTGPERRVVRRRPTPPTPPWGERYFHISDPDGHELSFARALDRPAAPTVNDDPRSGRRCASRWVGSHSSDSSASTTQTGAFAAS